MSTQRRRVLEGDKKLEIPADGVYIEGLDRKVYTVDEWQSGDTANSVVVASGDVKFRVSLTTPSLTFSVCGSQFAAYDEYMTEITVREEAFVDYDGVGNTANMLKVEPSTEYAAGYCNAFIFPDGKTRGYLPSCGQLYLVNILKGEVEVALRKCGNTNMEVLPYPCWSSTFYGKYRGVCTSFYAFRFDLGAGGPDTCAYYRYAIWPFADIS